MGPRNTDYSAAFAEGLYSTVDAQSPYDGQPGALRAGWAAGRTAQDRAMESVYRYVPTLGHERAITHLAGPDAELAAALRTRYDVEMKNFTDNGGY